MSFALANANVHPQPLVRAKRFCDWQHSLFILICGAQQQVLSEATSKGVEAERALRCSLWCKQCAPLALQQRMRMCILSLYCGQSAYVIGSTACSYLFAEHNIKY